MEPITMNVVREGRIAFATTNGKKPKEVHISPCDMEQITRSVAAKFPPDAEIGSLFKFGYIGNQIHADGCLEWFVDDAMMSGEIRFQ